MNLSLNEFDSPAPEQADVVIFQQVTSHDRSLRTGPWMQAIPLIAVNMALFYMNIMANLKTDPISVVIT